MATGLATIERNILLKLGLPRSTPYFFASPKVAITLAFVKTVIAETVASNRGIGNLMLSASSNYNVPLVFAGVVVLSILGVLMYVAAAALERRTSVNP